MWYYERAYVPGPCANTLHAIGSGNHLQHPHLPGIIMKKTSSARADGMASVACEMVNSAFERLLPIWRMVLVKLLYYPESRQSQLAQNCAAG
jgi:hypothetical protein